MIDIEQLAAWMDDVGLPGKGEPVEHAYVSGGSQNEIYEIRRGELHGAVRIPPSFAPESRDAGILREWRIIDALDGTEVPHTAALGVCEDPSVLGRTFYLMGWVDGWSPMNTDGWPAPFDTDLEARQGLAYQLVEGIALLGNVDWRAKGLQDLGRPDGFHERQVDDLDYYIILAKWKLAVVLEQGFQRAGDDPKLEAFGPVVLDLMRGAAEVAETTDYGR